MTYSHLLRLFFHVSHVHFCCSLSCLSFWLIFFISVWVINCVRISSMTFCDNCTSGSYYNVPSITSLRLHVIWDFYSQHEHVLIVSIINSLQKTVLLRGLFVSTKQGNSHQIFRSFHFIVVPHVVIKKTTTNIHRLIHFQWPILKLMPLNWRLKFFFIFGDLIVFSGNYSNWHRHCREIEYHLNN